MVAKKRQITGSVISSGIVLGTSRIVWQGEVEIAELPIAASKVRAEIAHLHRAVQETVTELKELRDSAGEKMGGTIAKIFDAQLMIAEDAEFLKQVEAEVLKQRRNVGFVYSRMIQETVRPLVSSNDVYLRQMATDIEAVSSRVLAILSGSEKCDLKFAPNTILIGKSFTPGDIISYRQRKAVGFVVSKGGLNSHMALIARALMLPVILAPEGWDQIPGNCRIVLDGTTGEVIVDPSDDDWTKFQKKKRKHGPSTLTKIKRLTNFPPVTQDGRTVGIGANLSLSGPADALLASREIPVGLYRTEFLYLSYGGFPDEQVQYEYYSQIGQLFGQAPVVIRTFDLGYDKLSTHNIWPDEENPALGWRGIRPMLEMTELFKTQIRAILRASTEGSFRIMLPMISDLGELELAKKMINQVKLSLKKKKIRFDEEIQIGIMVEVPSAALMADRLAESADFLSIGTNDLTQYALAADRLNNKVARLYNSLHPSVLQLIKLTVKACKKHGKPVSICGEVAGDSLAVPLFIGMGVDLLSINPNRIVDICRLISRIDSERARTLAESVLESGSIKEVKDRLTTFSLAIAKK
ncbi:MAG: phosphoenolpyruvate--protein phosphotransferase [bacterium]|nr:phosphoenolpyruvate--protein phosphotransferase [bacterium]